jgi:hypothetical protein
MSELNLQSALHRLISATQIGQQRGLWSSQESILLNEAINFFVKTPIMVVPPHVLNQLAIQQNSNDVSMKSQRVLALDVPIGSESVQM